MFLYGETVYVQSPSTMTDPFSGETVESWDEPTETPVDGVAVAPRTTEEPTEAGRTKTVVGLTLYMPYSTAISSSNRIRRTNGYVYEVVGDPAYWKNPYTGTEAGCTVDIKVVTG